MREPVLFKEVTDKELDVVNNIKHDISQYVDDLTNSVGGESLSDIKNYITQFIKLL